MKIELVLIDLIKVLLYVVEVLESEAEVALSEVGGGTLSLIPHALHVVNI